MTERCSPFNEEAFQEEDGRDTALSADLFLWEERQKRQKPISFPRLVYQLTSRINLSSENRRALLSTLGIVGSISIDSAVGVLTGVRPGVDPTIHMMVFAIGSSWGFLWGVKNYLEGMNG